MKLGEEEIRDFYGVYLLCSLNDHCRGQTYIGYTVDPNRRIKQHNKGEDFGGARKTSNRGPWKIVMIVHGFLNNISALRFEWAWQQPKTSRRLKMIKSIEKKKAKESHVQHKFRILCEMLRIGPWKRLPLTVRWLSDEHYCEFPPEKLPPIHMQITFGHVKRQVSAIKPRVSPAAESTADESMIVCGICREKIDHEYLRCLNASCSLISHIICLSRTFLESENGTDAAVEPFKTIIPVESECPECRRHLLWGDLIRKKNGSIDLVELGKEEENEEWQDFYESDNQSEDNGGEQQW